MAEPEWPPNETSDHFGARFLLEAIDDDNPYQSKEDENAQERYDRNQGFYGEEGV